MSFEQLPETIEQDVVRYAEKEHISHDEAVIRLIETGLSATGAKTAPNAARGKKPGELLIGMFSDPDDAAVFEDAMAYSRDLCSLNPS